MVIKASVVVFSFIQMLIMETKPYPTTKDNGGSYYYGNNNEQ